MGKELQIAFIKPHCDATSISGAVFLQNVLESKKASGVAHLPIPTPTSSEELLLFDSFCVIGDPINAKTPHVVKSYSTGSRRM